MNARANTPRRKGAFTLIELLVVIAIIALLVSILVPSLSAAREVARRAVCMSNLKSVGLSFIMYGQDNQDLVPPWRYAPIPGNTAIRYGWGDMIVKYIDSGAKTTMQGYEGQGQWRVSYTPTNGNPVFPATGAPDCVHSMLFNCPSQKYTGQWNQEYQMRRTWDNMGGGGTPQNILWYTKNATKYTAGPSFPNGHNPSNIGMLFERGYNGYPSEPNALPDGSGWDSINWNAGMIVPWIQYRMPHIGKTTDMLMLSGRVVTWTQPQLLDCLTLYPGVTWPPSPEPFGPAQGG